MEILKAFAQGQVRSERFELPQATSAGPRGFGTYRPERPADRRSFFTGRKLIIEVMRPSRMS